MKNKDFSKVGIIGGGEFGQSIGRAFNRRRIEVQIYDTNDDRSSVATIDELVRNNRLIILCVPSWANRQVIKEVRQHASDSKPLVVISVSKGVEKGFITMDKVLGEHLEEPHVYGLAYGPMIAEEIAVGRHAAGVLALSDMSWFDNVSKFFAQAKVVLEPSSDLEGLALCGVLKNIYAIAFGMSDGMHLGDNARGQLAVIVLREMKRVLIHLESDPQLAEGLSGLGDLITTGMTESSFNYRVGKTIAEGIADEGIKSEGLNTLKELVDKIDVKQYPLLHTLNKMIYHYSPTSELEKLLIK